MSLFILDTNGDKDLLEKNEADHVTFENFQNEEKMEEEPAEDGEDETVCEGIPPPKRDISHIIDKALSRAYVNNKEEDEDQVESLTDFMRSCPWTSKKPKQLGKTDVEKEMQNSVIRDIEEKKAIPCPSEKKQRELRRKEREKTKGKDWFNIPATEVTEEVENDLKILQMRSALDPKHFYKKNDLKVLPKYFQIGTVQHSPLDYYNERDTRRNKKRTIVDELLADAEFQKYNKRKFKEVMQKRQQLGYKKAMKKMRKLKKNK